MQKDCKTNRFFGKYYKFVTKDNESIAFITYTANKVRGLQVITHDGSYQISNPDDIYFSGSTIIFKVNQIDIKINGTLALSNLVKPKKDVMGIFRCLPIECKHHIYAFLGDTNGSLMINDKELDFNDGKVYIEGDEGKSFPKKYLWINGIDKDSSFTVSVATIPMGIFKLLGHFAYLYINNKEYIFATYNCSKIKGITREYILFKKFRYRLKVFYNLSFMKAHSLKAPSNGDMSRYIREAISTPTRVMLFKGKKLLYDKKYPNSSLENVGII